ncbi:MAG: Xaa-Pro aminopeptidase [Candidatus Saccharicenans sp.]
MPVKPALYLSEKNLGVRIKDAIPIIKVSSMVLSIDWPREIDEIKARLIKINF